MFALQGRPSIIKVVTNPALRMYFHHSLWNACGVTNKMINYIGNRANILFKGAFFLFYHVEHMKDHKNNLLLAVEGNVNEKLYLAELKALGLFYRVAIKPLWDIVRGKDGIFAFLLSKLSFDHFTTRQDRWKHDRFAAFSEMHILLNRNCAFAVTPDEFLTIDETLYPMRTSFVFRQYKPNKPTKYGLLYKSINASRYPYTFLAAPFL